MYKFLLICPISFENILKDELIEKWPIYFNEMELPEITIIKGGLEIETKLEYGLKLNYILRTAQRILLRIKEQKCRDLPKLYKIVKKINWKEFLKQKNIEVKVTANKSRLIHTRKIEKAALDGVHDYFSANQLKSSVEIKNIAPQKVLIRIHEDVLTISLDTSGELLYKRSSQKFFRGNAPLRETYAASLLKFLIKDEVLGKTTRLLDPMCGSGTFLKEARDYYQLNNERLFAFEYWNIPHLKKVENPKSLNSPFKELIGQEIDNQVFENLKEIKGILFLNKDSLSQKDKLPCDYLIVNPPYGKKVKIKEKRDLFFDNIIDQFKVNFSPKKMGIIIPIDVKIKHKPLNSLIFNQNGIKVRFCLF